VQSVQLIRYTCTQY